ncbi:PhzF family phenazine biosynthesis isomerase [Streptomyces sp. NPDC094032]|uniref:PhzF family phenazine biosynthesis protein n=1 Tax=Streptomyces sp. NPDC094032 TaxID=3155308 RepID=UPI003325F481
MSPAAGPATSPAASLAPGPAAVTLVRACPRDGTGGSPTAVVVETGAPMSDEERRAVPGAWGASHAVYVRVRADDGPEPTVNLRFFTAEGELPACGHGTVAALVLLASRAAPGAPYRATLRTARRAFAGRARVAGDRGTGLFDPGPVDLRAPTAAELGLVLPALGLAPGEAGPDVRVAGVGRERILVPVASRAALAALAPDFPRLRAACDRLGLLGAYVHSPPSPSGSLAARMFAPSIGVPEDIANANSTACLAAHLAGRGLTDLAVDMGDALGSPARITATVVTRAGDDRPGGDLPGGDPPGIDRSDADRPGGDRPGGVRPDRDRPAPGPRILIGGTALILGARAPGPARHASR